MSERDRIGFILSLNHRPEVREVFSEFLFADVGLTYTLHGGEGSKLVEVIILDNNELVPAILQKGMRGWIVNSRPQDLPILGLFSVRACRVILRAGNGLRGWRTLRTA